MSGDRSIAPNPCFPAKSRVSARIRWAFRCRSPLFPLRRSRSLPESPQPAPAGCHVFPKGWTLSPDLSSPACEMAGSADFDYDS